MMTVTLDIVTTAALLFVVATGLLVIFGVLKIINFAHGAFLTVGAYGALVTTAFDLNPWLSFPSVARSSLRTVRLAAPFPSLARPILLIALSRWR